MALWALGISLKKIIFSSWLLWPLEISETTRKTSELQGVTKILDFRRQPSGEGSAFSLEFTISRWEVRPQGTTVLRLSRAWVRGEEGSEVGCIGGKKGPVYVQLWTGYLHWGARRWAESEDRTKVYKVSKSADVFAPEAFLGPGRQRMKGRSHL